MFARASAFRGTVKPIFFAVFELITSSKTQGALIPQRDKCDVSFSLVL
jgi:hypothetical protein